MEDYELENARTWDENLKPKPDPDDADWQVVSKFKKNKHVPNRTPAAAAERNSGSQPPTQPASRQAHRQAQKARQPPQRFTRTRGIPAPRRPPPRMFVLHDDTAEILWRKREPPTNVIKIPPEVALLDRTYERIASEHSTFIQPKDVQGSDSFIFGIWGDHDGVAAAKHAIQVWIKEVMPSKSSSGSAKLSRTRSLTPREREKEEKKWEREVKRQRFRMYPPLTMPFGAIGSFHWPTNEYQPDEVLGTTYQALDPIRMDTSCYIVFNKERSLFQVMGDAKNVKNALMRIRKTWFQVAARQINSVRAYLLDPSVRLNFPRRVQLREYRDPSSISRNGQSVASTSFTPLGEGALKSKQTGSLQQSRVFDINRIRVAVQNILPKLQYFHGHLDMRVRLGTFLLTQYVKSEGMSYDLQSYVDMTEQSQFTGRVTEEFCIGKLQREAFQLMPEAEDVLATQSLTTTALSDTRPIYSASFLFAEDSTDLTLSVTWNEAIESNGNSVHLNAATKKWTRAEREHSSANKLIDMTITNLHGKMAWHFELTTSQMVEDTRLPQDLIHFANRLHIDRVALSKPFGRGPFIVYNPHPKLKSVRQSMNYCYNVKQSDYTLELSHYQDRVYEGKGSNVPCPEPVVLEPCWALSMFRSDWANAFSKNERLAVGESADWEHAINTWFPEDLGLTTERGDQGFEHLLAKMKRIADLTEHLL